MVTSFERRWVIHFNRNFHFSSRFEFTKIASVLWFAHVALSWKLRGLHQIVYSMLHFSFESNFSVLLINILATGFDY